MNANRLIQILAAAAVVAGLGAGCIRATPVAPLPDYVPLPAPAASEAPADEAHPPVQPLGFAPMSYFEDKCARCHGSYGSFYGDSFGKNLSDDELQKVVREMAEGPAMAPLEPAQLDLETAYHRSLVDGRPFLVVTEEDEKSSTLKGETTPGATVEVEAGAHAVAATVDEHQWSVTLPKTGTDWTKLQVTAKKGDATTTLDLSEQTFSHQKPPA